MRYAGTIGLLGAVLVLVALLTVAATHSVGDTGGNTMALELQVSAKSRQDLELATARRGLAIRTRQVVALRAARRRDRLMLLHRPSVDEALRLASAVYGVPLWEIRSVARCESNLNPSVTNRQGSGAAGLTQFMPSTFSGTPPGRAGLSVFSPYANALAAGWLWSRSGWRAWACKPGSH